MDATHLLHLTDVQRRVLRLAAGGATPAEIALRLNWSLPTVELELTRLVVLLGVPDTRSATLAWWASRAGARVDLDSTTPDSGR
jgi:DNA-binding NarL/FixJ family response regulator